MAKSKSKKSNGATKAKKAAPKAAKNAGMERISDAATGNVKVAGDVVVATARMARQIGERNVHLMARTMERGFETGQAVTSAGDLRTAVELQTDFAKSVVSAYASEIGEQVKLYKGFWQDVVTPLRERVGASTERFQSAL